MAMLTNVDGPTARDAPGQMAHHPVALKLLLLKFMLNWTASTRLTTNRYDVSIFSPQRDSQVGVKTTRKALSNY